MKVLSGLYKPSKGELYFDGNKEVLESPRDSQNLGLEMVYQDLALAEVIGNQVKNGIRNLKLN